MTDSTAPINQWLRLDEEVDLNNCDRELIHLPNGIQPRGYLVVMNTDGQVVQESANVRELREPDVRALLEQTRGAAAHRDSLTTRTVQVDGRPHDIVSHRVDGLLVTETEPRYEAPTYPFSVLRDCMPRIAGADDFVGALQIGVRAIREISQFDRVLAYMFGSEGHGSVVAEERVGGMEPLLGLQFPATDIPKQARRLYVLQRNRLIHDVNADPVPLVPEVAPQLGRPLNMARCQLRAVSPIHLEYLRNMGVRASCSFSIVVDGELAGLIACHHQDPHIIDWNTRTACELVADRLSDQFLTVAVNDERRERDHRIAAQAGFMGALAKTSSLSASSDAWSTVVELVDADAFLIELDGEHRVLGDHVDIPPKLWEAGGQLAARCEERVHASHQLSLTASDLAGATLVVPVLNRGWVGWYRQPEVTTIVWSGRPPTAEEVKDLSPRHSFEAWKETVENRSKRWTDHEIALADIVRRGVLARFVPESAGTDGFEDTLRHLQEYTATLEDTNLALQASNEDLRQFAYVVSHDFKSPVRTIRTVLPMLKDELGAAAMEANVWFSYVTRAADTLHRLQEGLWGFSQVTRETRFESVDLGQVVDGIIASLAADHEEAAIEVDIMPTVWGIREQLDTVFLNVLQNALKYRSPERPLQVRVRADEIPAGIRVVVEDNGIGLPQGAEDRAFELFTRLHPDHKDGDGLGLAMCRRIMNHHRGRITAHSGPSEGTSIELFFRSERSE